MRPRPGTRGLTRRQRRDHVERTNVYVDGFNLFYGALKGSAEFLSTWASST